MNAILAQIVERLEELKTTPHLKADRLTVNAAIGMVQAVFANAEQGSDLLRLERDDDGSFYRVYVACDDKWIGDLVCAEDGDWRWWPESRGEWWPAYLLRAITAESRPPGRDSFRPSGASLRICYFRRPFGWQRKGLVMKITDLPNLDKVAEGSRCLDCGERVHGGDDSGQHSPECAMVSKCPHPVQAIWGDILEGEGERQVQWCEACGAFRFRWPDRDNTTRIKGRYTDWRTPQPEWYAGVAALV